MQKTGGSQAMLPAVEIFEIFLELAKKILRPKLINFKPQLNNIFNDKLFCR